MNNEKIIKEIKKYPVIYMTSLIEGLIKVYGFEKTHRLINATFDVVAGKKEEIYQEKIREIIILKIRKPKEYLK